MPYVLTATVGTLTATLTDGSPYKLEDAAGLGAPEVVRLHERGPLQNGLADLGYRVGPRTVTLSVLFRATSGSALDAHRTTLTRLFQPQTDTPIQLKLTRDDGATRQLECYTTTGTDIEIVPLQAPGNLHRAVVQLRAASPYWSSTATPTGTATPYDKTLWATLGTAATPLDYASNLPAGGTAITYSGTIAAASSGYTIAALVSGVGTAGTPTLYQFGTSTPVYLRWVTGSAQWQFDSLPAANYYNTYTPTTGTAIYIIKVSGANQVTLRIFNTGGTEIGVSQGQPTHAVPLDETQRWWGGPYTGQPGTAFGTVSRIALYASQLQLNDLMLIYYSPNNYFQPGTIVNAGDVAVQPLVTLRGYLTNPVVTNSTTGKTLTLTGTINTGETIAIDLRTADKTVLDGAGSPRYDLLPSLTEMTQFAVAPGTNTFTITAGSIGSAALATFACTPKYLGY